MQNNESLVKGFKNGDKVIFKIYDGEYFHIGTIFDLDFNLNKFRIKDVPGIVTIKRVIANYIYLTPYGSEVFKI